MLNPDQLIVNHDLTHLSDWTCKTSFLNSWNCSGLLFYIRLYKIYMKFMSARNLLQNYFPFFQQFLDAILSFTRPSPLSFLQVFGGELALQRALTQETARLSSLNNLLSHRYASWSISGYKFRASWLKNPKRLVLFGLLLFSLQFRAEVLGNHPLPTLWPPKSGQYMKIYITYLSLSARWRPSSTLC